MIETARTIQDSCGVSPFIYRAGAWKPRTSPSSFQGAGEQALEWLAEVKRELQIPVATEVATAEHVTAALQAGIDYLWIGARTSANPIAVEAIARQIKNEKLTIKNSLRGIFIKNPVNPDADLWIGNIERLEKTGVPVMAVHRGCGHKPCWAIAHAVRTQRPDIPLLIDPSHMSGYAARIPTLLRKAVELDYEGTMMEVHCDPKSALSDSNQQITPTCLRDYLNSILSRLCPASLICPSESSELHWLRAEIDELDDLLWSTISARMDVSQRIGEWKKAHGIAPLQPERFQQILSARKEWAAKNGIPAAFVEQVFAAIHKESLQRQE